MSKLPTAEGGPSAEAKPQAFSSRSGASPASPASAEPPADAVVAGTRTSVRTRTSPSSPTTGDRKSVKLELPEQISPELPHQRQLSEGSSPRSSSKQRKVTVTDHDYQTLRNRRHAAEEVPDVLATAIRWLDAIECLAKVCNPQRDRFSMQELNKMVGSREQMADAGFDDAKCQLVMKALFITQSDEDMQKAFEIFDIGHTGSISKEDLRQSLPLMGESNIVEKCDALFDIVDADGTGEIEFGEFSNLVRAMNPKEGADISSAITGFMGGMGGAGEQASGWFNKATEATADFAGDATMALGAMAFGDAPVKSVSRSSVGGDFANKKAASQAQSRMEEAGASCAQARALAEAFYHEIDPDDKDEVKWQETLRKKAFNRLDIDNSGDLNKEELRKLLALLDQEISEERIDELMGRVDTDGSGNVSFEEFSQLMKDMAKKEEEAGGGGWFGGWLG